MRGKLFATVALAALLLVILLVVAIAVAVIAKVAGASDFVAGASYAATMFVLPAVLAWLAERV